MKNRISKKLIAIVLVISLVLTVTSLFAIAAEQEEELNIYVAADLHYLPPDMVGDISEIQNLPENELYHYAPSKAHHYAESEAIVYAMLEEFAASEAEFLLLPGDITEDGQIDAHHSLAQILKDFEDETGKSIFVINGNHDILGGPLEDSILLEDFKEIYADFGYNEALVVHDTSASYVVDLNSQYRLIAVDSCIYGSDHGTLTDDVLAFIEEQALQAREDGKYLIGMMHHNLTEHFLFQKFFSDDFVIDDHRENSRLFADFDIKYVFTGHFHANSIVEVLVPSGKKVYDIQTCSLITYPMSYRHISFSENAVDVKTYNIESIDVSKLPPGFSQAQLEAIENDFHAYSYGYFEASNQAWINSYIGSSSKIMRMLNVEADSEIGQLLEMVMPILAETISTPIYMAQATDGTSFEEVAASLGITLPESEYETIAQLFAFVLGSFFSGDQNFPADSLEVQLFLSSLKVALSMSFGTIFDEAATNGKLAELIEKYELPINVEALSNEIAYNTAKYLFANGATNKALRLIVYPLLEGFTVDAFEPGDIDVVLEPYNAEPQPQSQISIIFEYIKKIFSFLENLMSTFSIFNVL